MADNSVPKPADSEHTPPASVPQAEQGGASGAGGAAPRSQLRWWFLTWLYVSFLIVLVWTRNIPDDGPLFFYGRILFVVLAVGNATALTRLWLGPATLLAKIVWSIVLPLLSAAVFCAVFLALVMAGIGGRIFQNAFF